MKDQEDKLSIKGIIEKFFSPHKKEEQESQERDDSHKFGSEVRHKLEEFYVRHIEGKLKHPGEFLFDVRGSNKTLSDSTMEKFIQLSSEVDAEFAAKDLKKSMVEKLGSSIANGAKTAKNWIGSKLPTFKRNKTNKG